MCCANSTFAEPLLEIWKHTIGMFLTPKNYSSLFTEKLLQCRFVGDDNIVTTAQFSGADTTQNYEEITMARTKTAPPTPVTKTAPPVVRKKAESNKLLEAVSKLDAQSVINEVGTLQTSLQTTLAGLSAGVATKIEQMKQVDEAIELKEERLKELFGIEQEAMDIESIKQQKADEEESFDKTREKRDAEWADEANARAKNWQREREEHDYAMAQQKKRALEEYTAEVSERKRREQIRQEELQRGWDAREAALKAQEAEVVELRKQVAEFDAKLKSEVAKAEAIVGNRLKKDYEHETALLKRDSDAAQKLADAEKLALNNTIANLSEQIDSLEKAVVTAQKDAKEAVIAALDSASGRKAAEAVQQAINATAGGGKK